MTHPPAGPSWASDPMTTKYQSGARVSEYVLETCVGAGTFGEVWQARHHIWDSDRVAIKLPTEPEYVRYLQREGIVVHGLRHPNIIRVVGLDPYAETPYLIMELVKGPSLRQAVDEHPHGMPLNIVLVVLRGLLRAMSAAHEANVIHRDLKPGNVLLHLDGRALATLNVDDVKVGDFGLGFANEDTLRSMVAQSASITRDSEGAAIAGTLAYMAPEVRDGQQSPSPRSDLYAIGVILFEMLTGERPAGAESPSALRPESPPLLDRVFAQLYTRYDRRFESADAVLAVLDKDAGAAPPKLPAVPPRVPRVPAPPPVVGSCPSCHGAIEIGDQFCTQCGAQLRDHVRRCASCGGYPGPDDRFCIFCGAALADEE